MAGKGDRARPGVYSQEFRDNFDRIFGDRRKKKPGLAKEKKGMGGSIARGSGAARAQQFRKNG